MRLGSSEGLLATEDLSKRLMGMTGLRVLGMSGLNSVPQGCLSSHGIVGDLSICGMGRPQQEAEMILCSYSQESPTLPLASQLDRVWERTV